MKKALREKQTLRSGCSN